MPPQTTRHVALRIPEHQLEQIDALANDYRLNRTAYIIQASTGQLDGPTNTDQRNNEQQFNQIDLRLLRIELELRQYNSDFAVTE